METAKGVTTTAKSVMETVEPDRRHNGSAIR